MIKIAICDDSDVAIGIIHNFLDNYFSELSIEYNVTEYTRGENLVYDYEEGFADYSLIFLDIFMDKMSGIDVAKNIRRFDDNVKLVFATASKEHMLEGYDVFAFGYVIKPLEIEKLQKICNRFLSEEKNIVYNSLLIKHKRKDIRLNISEIMYIESQNTAVTIHMTDGNTYKIYLKLQDIEDRINDSGLFIRCHQSYIVNMNFVKSVDNSFFMIDGAEIPIRQRERKQIKTEYIAFLNSNQ